MEIAVFYRMKHQWRGYWSLSRPHIEMCDNLPWRFSHHTENINVQQVHDVDMYNGTEIQTERRLSPPMATTPVVDGVQGLTETKSYAAAVVGKDMSGSGECFTVSNDEVLVSDEDVRILCDGFFPVVQFSDRVHDMLDHSMRKNESDYVRVLTDEPWTIYGSYLTVQPWSFPYSYYLKGFFRHIAMNIGNVIRVDYKTDASDRGHFSRLAIRLEKVAPRSHENAEVAVGSRFSILNDTEGGLKNQEVSPDEVTPCSHENKVSAWHGNGKNDLVASSGVAPVSSKGSLQDKVIALEEGQQAVFNSHTIGIRGGWHSAIVITEDGGAGIGSRTMLGKASRSKKSQGSGVRKVLSVKKQTKLRLPSPHVLSEWIPTVSNSLSLRVVSSQRTDLCQEGSTRQNKEAAELY
ncbi:hypothetical protein GQ457_16G015910 [Hibiscus cannabinus]